MGAKEVSDGLYAVEQGGVYQFKRRVVCDAHLQVELQAIFCSSSPTDFSPLMIANLSWSLRVSSPVRAAHNLAWATTNDLSANDRSP
jgi:hypothetical protein